MKKVKPGGTACPTAQSYFVSKGGEQQCVGP